MIIITSNEDIIRQFSSRQIEDTHIIHLNNDEHTVLIDNNNTTSTNISFLGELSGANPTNDQIYKRALDTVDHEQTKAVKVSKKSNDPICAICGDTAIGHNYDVLSCASCKIFFHRNANQNLDDLRCLSGQRQCSVEYGVRRKCPRCRLEKCFSAGMKKSLLLTSEELQRRRKHHEQNRTDPIENRSASNQITLDEFDHIDTNMIDVHSLFETLSIEDWLTIENLRLSFESIFGNDTVQCACVDVSDRMSALLSWSQFIQTVLLRFINFFRQINEFQDLDVDDRLILIKYNTFPLLIISKCAHYQPENDCCSSDNSEMANNHRRFFMLCDASYHIREMFVNLVLSLVQITKQDFVLLSLLSIILIAYPGLTINENDLLLKDPLAVNRVQTRYTQLLWSYLINQLGDHEASKYFTQILNIILRIQSDMKILKDFFRHQYLASNAVDQMAPLMQTILQIS